MTNDNDPTRTGATPSWFLANADELAAAHKYTFYKPSRELIAKLQPGDEVKLIFRFQSADPEAPSGERMWVTVETVNGDGTFVGRLDNTPAWIEDLALGDPIVFDAAHIINTQHDDHDNLVERYIKRCFVTRRILDEGARVGYLYREAPDRDEDSGWRFMAGDESQAYMDDADNLALVSLGALLSLDDSFVELLDAPEGAQFERDEITGGFVAVDDEA